MAKNKYCSNCETKIAAYDEPEESAAGAIYNSHINGNGRQMVKQIEDNGVYDTIVDLENMELSESEQLLIWKKYLRIKNR